MILASNDSFRNVFRLGAPIHSEYFSIYFVKERELRVGFTTRKDYKNKPTRNRMKRILRELWRKIYRSYQLPAHIVIVANNKILDAEYNVLNEQMNDSLAKIENRLKESRLE